MVPAGAARQIEQVSVAAEDDQERTGQRIRDLLATYSIEVTPAAAAKHARLADLLPADQGLRRVPAGRGLARWCGPRRASAPNLVPVPHFPARSITDRGRARRLSPARHGEAGVDEVLVIGGGIDLPRGAFPGRWRCSRPACSSATASARSASPAIPRASASCAPGVTTTLEQKLAYAGQTGAEVRLVTQFLFEPAPLLAWERAIRGQGTPADPCRRAGPGDAQKPAGYARLCGVGNSMRVLTRQAGNLLKLASLSYPDALITALARPARAIPIAGSSGCTSIRSAASPAPRAGSRRSAPAPLPCTTTASASRSTPPRRLEPPRSLRDTRGSPGRGSTALRRSAPRSR